MRERTSFMRRFNHILLGLLLALLALPPLRASAHATLLESDPPSNAIIADAPPTARLRFTEPLEPTYSRVVLASAESGPIATAPSRVDPDDPYVLLLDLPPLAEGVYALQWRTLSTADGHTMTGTVPFVIGDPSAADAPLTLPPAPPNPLAAPPAADMATRWLILLGLSLAVGGLLFRLLIWRPAETVPAAAARFDQRARRIEIAGAALAITGTLGALLVASATAEANPILFVVTSRVGLMLGLRLTLSAILLAILWTSAPMRLTGGLIVGGGALLTISLLSHSASSPGAGFMNGLMRAIAIGFDWLHLLATSAWIGGLAALLPALAAARQAQPAQRSRSLTHLIARFTGVATGAVVILAATGTFAALQHMSAVSELWTTTYGRALLIKLGLFGVLLLLGGFNRWYLHPRLSRSGGESRLRVMQRSIGAEIGVGIMLLLAVGALTASTPGRAAAAQGPGTTHTARVGSVQLSLQVLRSDVAGDIYAVTAYGLPQNAQPEAVLRASMPAHHEDVQELRLERVEPNRWGARGALLTMPGAWNIETILRAPGMNDIRHTFIVDTAMTQPGATTRAAMPLWIALVIVALVLTALSQLPIARLWQGRFQTSALLMVAAAFVATTVPYYFARATERRNPLTGTPEVLAAGETIYRQHCASCHGATGRGDGPAAATLPGLPADFTIPHFATHTDAEVFGWIQNGKPSTAMPAFGDRLSEEQIWQVVTYIRKIYQDAQAAQR